jgi:hypothetical protein
MRSFPAVGRLLAVLVLVSACDRADLNPTESTDVAPDIKAFVAGEAARHLGPDGRFSLASARAPDDVPIITSERARELAEAFLRTWGESHAPVWERERGEQINIGALELSPVVYYALTPHGRFPDGYHGAYRRMVGPWYILHFTSGGEPVLGLAISAYSTDLTIEDGLIRQPREGGTYFEPRAVAKTSRARHGYSPMTPEDAVALVGSVTGAQVTDVPELVVRNSGWDPLLAHWKLTLDRPVRVIRKEVRGSSAPGERAAVREIYVAPGGILLIPGHGQPASERMAVVTDVWSRAANPPHVFVDVPRRGSAPVRYDEVVLDAEG